MKKSVKKILIVVVSLLAAGSIVYTVARKGLDYLDDLIFTERQTQLQEVVNQYYQGIELVTEDSWNTAHELEQRLLQENLQTLEDVQDFFASEIQLQTLLKNECRPIAIRDDGCYLDEDGTHGSLGYVEPLMDCGERVNFIYEQPFTGNLFNLYVYKLEKAVEIIDGSYKYKVAFVGITRPMSSLNQYYRCSAYGGENSTYILDRYGSKQYVDQSSSTNLIEGHNVYTVLRKEAEAEGRNFDDILAELNEKGIVFSHISINGQQCFFSMRKMQDVDYTIIYMNPVDRVAVSTQRLVNMVMKVVVWTAVTILILIIVGSMYIMLRNRRQLLAETRSKQELSEMNEKLEQSNRNLRKAQDATKEALKTAETANKAKTDFLSNMSHDIRTPMNAIVGLTNLMEADLNDTEKIHQYLGKLKSSSNHLLNLINEILDMSKIEAGKATLNIASFCMAEQVAQIENVIRPQIQERNQKFTIQITRVRHEYLEGDATRLQQILLNLLSNAVKYTERGGSIELDIEEIPRDGCYARYKFIVADNGIGMSEEYQKHIFESFTRAENSVTNRVQGTGLGMAITKNIVDMMGGSILMESELGEGSRFEIVLDFKIDADAGETARQSDLLFLCCDDSTFEQIQSATEESKVHVYRTMKEDAEKLEQLFQTGHYDVVIIPYQHYGDRLKAAMQKIRKLAGEDTVLLGIASASREEALEVIADSGLDGFVPLPFFYSNVEAEVSKVKAKRDSDIEQEEKDILNGMRFLCAEDNELNAEILKEILDMYGASCIIYPDGEAIVQAFKDVKPGEYDAVLMDVQMPKMNGLEATRAIRSGSNPLGKTIPIIAMTANAFSEDVQHCISAGMDAHIAKPIDIAVLEKTLRGFVSGGADNQTE